MTNGLLKGLSDGNVHDHIRAGDKEFKELSKKTEDRFEIVEDQTVPFYFTRVFLARNNDSEVIQDQHDYPQKLEQLPLEAGCSHFRSMCMKLAWLANTRLVCLFEISHLAQFTGEMFMQKSHRGLQRLNKAIDFAIKIASHYAY